MKKWSKDFYFTLLTWIVALLAYNSVPLASPLLQGMLWLWGTAAVLVTGVILVWSFTNYSEFRQLFAMIRAMSPSERLRDTVTSYIFVLSHACIASLFEWKWLLTTIISAVVLHIVFRFRCKIVEGFC